ncbi:MAG: asparagine synthase (glutamine-hydrolyzing) [Bacteroidota bacterium]
MCGIAGIVSSHDFPAPREALGQMLDALAHRGPDARGEWYGARAALGHQRLAIIDLTERGNQPMQDHTGRYTLVHNGEIYNFREVRARLDYPWKTETDTEMILAAYAAWGPTCLEHFNGMFAFAIWDAVDQTLFVARDRLGIKPLYYFADGGRLAFGSEVRSLCRVLPQVFGKSPQLNGAALAGYFTYQTVYGGASAVAGVHSLEPGQYLRWKVGHPQPEVATWWSIFASASPKPAELDPGALKVEIHNRMRAAVERRLMTDVPLGAFLSGGIDSSAVVALMSQVSERPVDTFSVVFAEKEYDESRWAKMIAEQYNTRHHPILLRPRDFLEALPAALRAMDHPSGDGINSYVVAQVTREQGITVALSGLGGDELFGGYPIFTQLPAILQHRMWSVPAALRKALRQPYGWLKSDRQAEKIKALMALPGPDPMQIYRVFRTIYNPHLAQDLVGSNSPEDGLRFLDRNGPALRDLPLLSQISSAEIYSYTQSVLLRDTDQMAMAHALEVRVPFFDHELVEFVLGVADGPKRPTYPKKLLVEALGDLLPHDLVHRKKMGFVFPWEQWLRHELRDFCAVRIQKLQDGKYLDADLLGKVWREFQQGKGPWLWTHIWLPVVLQEWMDNNGIAA